jgi:hypothetical protein
MLKQLAIVVAAVVIAGLSLALAVIPSAAQKADGADPARLAAAKKLMDVTGAQKQFDTVMPQVLAQLQPFLEKKVPSHKKQVAEVMTLMADKFAAKRNELIDQIAGLYAKSLTAEDLEALTKFFSDGAGKRYIDAIPALVQGSVAMGQQWGRKIGEEIQKEAEAELKKRGVPI